MDIDWGKLVDLSYWFEGVAGQVSSTPVIDPDSSFFWAYLWIFTIIFSTGVLTLAGRTLMNANNPLIKQMSLWGANLSWMGVLGLAWFLLREINIGFFGARFWLLVGLGWFFVLVYISFRYFRFIYPLEKHYKPA